MLSLQDYNSERHWRLAGATRPEEARRVFGGAARTARREEWRETRRGRGKGTRERGSEGARGGEGSRRCHLHQPMGEVQQPGEPNTALLVLTGPHEPIRFFEQVLAASGGLPAEHRGVSKLHVQFCDELRDEHLRGLPKSLIELRLDACHGLTDAGVQTLALVCGASLTSLSIYWNNHLSNRAAIQLSLHCKQLRQLSLSGCKGIGSTGILSLASRLRHLEELDLTRLPLVDDVAVTAIAQASRSLAGLRLYADAQLNDPPIIALAKSSGSSLTLLDCTGLNSVTDAAVLSLAEHCPRLRHLVLSWVLELTDRSLVAIARRCSLRLLSVHGIRGLTTSTLDALAENQAKSLEALDVRGCIGMGSPSPTELLQRLPGLTTFIIHT